MKCFSRRFQTSNLNTERIYLQIPHGTLEITESTVPRALPLPRHSTVRVSLKSLQDSTAGPVYPMSPSPARTTW